MLTLGDDALAKVKAGVTTAEELLRVVTEVREMRTRLPGLQRHRWRSTSWPVRPAARALERRVSGLRPRPAGGLDVLSVLRARHRGAKPSGGCASAESTRAPRELPASQRHRVQEGHDERVTSRLRVYRP